VRVGSAAAGLRPVVVIMFIDFITIAMDQIINHAARWHQLSNGRIRVPLVVCTREGWARATRRSIPRI